MLRNFIAAFIIILTRRRTSMLINMYMRKVVRMTVSKSLFSAESTDEETCSNIRHLSLVILEKCKHLLKDFFVDGVHSSPSAVDIQKAKSCPDNITVERLMAKLDSHLKSSPTCSTNSIENIVIYQKIKTDEWLRGKPEEEKCKNNRESQTFKCRLSNKVTKKEGATFGAPSLCY